MLSVTRKLTQTIQITTGIYVYKIVSYTHTYKENEDRYYRIRHKIRINKLVHEKYIVLRVRLHTGYPTKVVPFAPKNYPLPTSWEIIVFAG